MTAIAALTFLLAPALNAEESAPTLYMSFGQDRIRKGDRDKSPRVHLLTAAEFTDTEEIPVDPDNDPEMERAYPDENMSTMWKLELTPEQAATYSDAILYFDLREDPVENPEKKPYRKYHIALAGDRDADNWLRYIYYPDYQAVGDRPYHGAFVARQTYVTFDQFEAVHSSEKKKLYITGQGFANLKGSGGGTGTGGGTSPLVKGDYLTLDGSNGVFYAEITKGGTLSTATPLTPLPDGSTDPQKGARFTMSWMSPVEHHDVNCPGRALNPQRVQATFNLGIVGIDENHEAVTSGAVEIVRGHGNTKGNEVFCTPGRTIPVAHYNTADWFIRDKYIGRTDDEGNPLVYTLVVDLEPGCNTVSLLYFRPNPTVSARGMDITTAELTDPDQALRVYKATADRLDGETGAGPVVLSRVNVARANAELSAPSHHKLSGESPAGLVYDYAVAYEIYSDGVPAGTYEGEMSAEGNAKMSLDGVALGTEATIGVRAAYTDNRSGLHFHSRYSEGIIGTDDYVFPAPDNVNVAEKTFSTGTQEHDASGRITAYTLGAYALVDVAAPDFGDKTPLVWYAGFSLSCPDGYHAGRSDLADGGEVVYAGHPSTALQGDVVGRPVDDSYVPCVRAEDFTSAADWSSRLAAVTQWPLHLADVVRVEKVTSPGNFADEAPEAQINGTASVVYPFLIDPTAQIRTQAAARREAPARSFTPDPAKTYQLSYQSIPASFSFSLNSGDLTGVADIVTGGGAADAPAEYYDLRGVRVDTPEAPGVYICRRGITVEKILIR